MSNLKHKLKNAAAASLLLLLAASIVEWQLTRDANPARARKTPQAAGSGSPVDEKLLQTARRLASFADTAPEQGLALDAVHLADQELDGDYSIALREASLAAPPASGPLRELITRITELKARLAADQQHADQLAHEAAGNAAAGDKLELAKAQLALDQDELDDVQQDLARQGGDRHASLQRALEAHESDQHAQPPLPKLASGPPPGTLHEQVQLWQSLGGRQEQIDAARQDVDKKAQELTRQHKALEGSMGGAPAPAAAPSDSESDDDEDTAAEVAQLRHLADQRKTLMDLDKRVQICQQLAAIYQTWSGQVAARRRSALHLILGSLALILAALLAGLLVNRAVGHVLVRQADVRRRHQLRVMTSVGLQVATVMAVLLVIFGAPTQAPTIIGLATAGLTVVLKDFIVAFFGWFVLMGRNGIRVGDWVEINGVGGEVIEIGVLRTVLLEMGNWTITGHPTGRRVAFMNGFAIEGHYFNFSTTGQWLWDELQVTVALTAEPYRLADEIRQTVERETEADAQLAEQDWERVTRQYGTRAFSAKPAVDLRPGNTGLLVNVRYITRAPQRYVVKSRLFEAIVELIHNRAMGAVTKA